MVKKRNKKIKKEFKKILQQQILSNLNITETDNQVEGKQNKALKNESSLEVNKSLSFIKKDIKKTAAITTVIITIMFLIFYYLNLNNNYTEISQKITNFLGI